MHWYNLQDLCGDTVVSRRESRSQGTALGNCDDIIRRDFLTSKLNVIVTFIFIPSTTVREVTKVVT